MRKCLASLAAACLAIIATPALAQPPDEIDVEDAIIDPACLDENGRDLCADGWWSETIAILGLAPAEIEQRAGLRGIRVFTLDGYSSTMPAVTILGHGGAVAPRDLELRVHWERFNDAGRGQRASLTGLVPPDLWRRASDLQDLAARSPEHQPEYSSRQKTNNPDGDVVIICLHPWNTITEILTDQGVTRRVRNACGEDPLFDASFEIPAAALRALPDCGGIDPAKHRNGPTALSVCFALDGEDKRTAAEILSILEDEISTPGELEPRLAPDVRLTLPDGVVISGAAAAAKALASRELRDTSLYANLVRAGADSVTAFGYVTDYVGDDVNAALLQLVWSRRGGDWRIASIAISPFKIQN